MPVDIANSHSIPYQNIFNGQSVVVCRHATDDKEPIEVLGNFPSKAVAFAWAEENPHEGYIHEVADFIHLNANR